LAWCARGAVPAGGTTTFITVTGNAVDWFVILKHSNSQQYLYADAATPRLALSAHDVGGTSGALFNTLTPLFASEDHSWALYNDETPDGERLVLCPARHPAML
jgi:hypothetical protein